MENNIFETNHLSDEDKVKIVYEKYRIDAENLYLAAVKRWKKHLLIYMVLTVVSFIALLLFIFDIYGFMHLFYMFVSGIIAFFGCIACAQTYKNLRAEKQIYQFRLRNAVDRMEHLGLYFDIPQEDYDKFNCWWN